MVEPEDTTGGDTFARSTRHGRDLPPGREFENVRDVATALGPHVGSELF